MIRYRLTRRSEADLENIWLFTCAHWSPDQADRMIRRIRSTIELLAVHPEMGRFYEEIRPGLRKLPLKPYLIFYRNTSKNTILIIRILHQGMDIPEQL